MNRSFKILIFAKLLLIIFVSYSYSASTTGTADVYKVTMKKVELCTASTSVTSCENAIVIGNTEETVDIASATAGSSAASYGDTALLPLGVTYTHMRVTIDRKFTIQADLTVAGVDDKCTTTAAPCSIGLQITGEAVLSIINGILYFLPMSDTSLIGNTLKYGFGNVSA